VVVITNPVTEHLQIKGETLRLRSLADTSIDELLSKL